MQFVINIQCPEARILSGYPNDVVLAIETLDEFLLEPNVSI